MADREKITVLFVNPSEVLSGDTLSLGNLIESLRDKIEPIVLLTEKKTLAYEYFNSIGVECIVHKYLLLLEPRIWDKIKKSIPCFWRFRFIKWFRYELPCMIYLQKVLADRHIDIIHSNRSQVSMGYNLARKLNIPHVWHIRQYPIYGNYRIYRGLSHLQKLINSADFRIVSSEICKQSWELKEDNTSMLLDAVRSITDCCYEKEKQPYILFCSNMINKFKGAGRAVEAFGKSGLFTLSGSENPIRLKIVGNCNKEYKKVLLTLAGRYGCSEFIDFIPAQKNVKEYFTHAMAFVNPSINEGMGRTSAEAMFYGCPVIAHASGGTLDLIKDGETGYLFNTVDEMAELMKKVCTSDQEKVILRAQEFAKNNLSVENYGEKIMGIYKKVLKNN